MQPHEVHWDEDDNAVTVNTVGELDALLDKLHAETESPILVCVSGPTGSLTIGVGHITSILNFIYSDGNSPYPISDNGSADVTEHDFTMCGHHSAFAGKNLIPNDLARDAMRVFVEYGALSLDVRWAWS